MSESNNNLSWEDATIEVLKTAKGAMHYTDIAKAIVEQKLRSKIGATPAASVSTAIPARSRVTVQVKTWPTGSDRFKSRNVDYLIGLDVQGLGSFSAEWLLEAACRSQSVRTWLARSLNWLPTEFLMQFKLN
jgi:hypothetical protein